MSSVHRGFVTVNTSVGSHLSSRTRTFRIRHYVYEQPHLYGTCVRVTHHCTDAFKQRVEKFGRSEFSRDHWTNRPNQAVFYQLRVSGVFRSIFGVWGKMFPIKDDHDLWWHEQNNSWMKPTLTSPLTHEQTELHEQHTHIVIKVWIEHSSF